MCYQLRYPGLDYVYLISKKIGLSLNLCVLTFVLHRIMLYSTVLAMPSIALVHGAIALVHGGIVDVAGATAVVLDAIVVAAGRLAAEGSLPGLLTPPGQLDLPACRAVGRPPAVADGGPALVLGALVVTAGGSALVGPLVDAAGGIAAGGIDRVAESPGTHQGLCPAAGPPGADRRRRLGLIVVAAGGHRHDPRRPRGCRRTRSLSQNGYGL